jgi:hypothetical protein
LGQPYDNVCGLSSGPSNGCCVLCACACIEAGGCVLHLVLAHPTVSNMQAVSSWMIGVHQAQQLTVTQLLQKHVVSAHVVAELHAFTTIMPGSQSTTQATLATTAPLEGTAPMLLQQLGGCIHSTLVVVSYCKLNGPTFDWSTSCRSSQQSNSKFDCRITISMLTCPLLQKTSVGF